MIPHRKKGGLGLITYKKNGVIVPMSAPANKLIEEASQLITSVGYNDFSYADLPQRLSIRKSSIHHHYPSKVALR
jgi:AcrR family transcriptional regulator